MKIRDIIHKFMQLEYDNNYFDLEVQGVRFWHYIRFNIYYKILAEKFDKGEAAPKLKNESRIKNRLALLAQIPNCITKNPLWGLKNKDILVYQSGRRIKNGNYYDYVRTDYFLNELDYSYYVFEHSIEGKHFNPVRTKNLLYFDYIDLMVLLKTKLYRRNKIYEIKPDEKDLLFSLIKDINKAFDVNIKPQEFNSTLQGLVRSYHIRKKYITILLEKVAPKAIIEVNSYGLTQLLINEVASEKDIKVIELQHGTMGKYHIAYNFLPPKKELTNFPDYIFLYGEHWKSCTRLPLPEDRLRVTGFPYFEEKLKKSKTTKRKSVDKKNILFISQGPVGKQLSKIAIDLNNKIDKDQYNIIYKLHPREFTAWKDVYPWLAESKIKVIDNYEKDIYYWFGVSDYMVGVYSTAMYEGLGFGLKAFIAKLYGHEYMEELIDSGYADLITSADDIIDKLDGNETGKKLSSYFWKEDSINNIKKELKNIIE